MKARLPQGKNSGVSNMQQLARQAQKMQDNMEKATQELEQKEYSTTVGGGMVTATVYGKMEVKSIEINPEVVNADDVEMLSDMIAGAINESLRVAAAEKEETMNEISGGINIPGLF